MHSICEKCKLGNGFLSYLAGGVVTILCPICTTKWHALTRDHESLRKMSWANTIMKNVTDRNALCVADPDYIYIQAQRLHSEHSNILFDLALEWLGRKG